MNITLKKATADDVADFVRIEKAVESPINLVITDPTEALKEIQNSHAYMIKADEAVVGLVVYRRKKPNQAFISEIAVDPKLQGQGIGSKALSFIMGELKEVPRVELMTHPANPARRLYERFGFTVCGKIENYQGRGTPRLVMARIL